MGRSELINRIERHPLARALRVDKLTLAALEATLRLYLDREAAWREVPVLAMARASSQTVRQRAEQIHARLSELDGLAEVTVRPDQAYVGGGSLPMQAISTWVVAVRPRELTEDELAKRLRTGDPAVVPRVHDGYVLFDARTIRDEQVQPLTEAVARALK